MAKSWQDHGKIIAGSWQDLADLTKILQELAGFKQDRGKIIGRSWQDHDMIMARSWCDHSKILQDLTKILQDLTKILEELAGFRQVSRSCKNRKNFN